MLGRIVHVFIITPRVTKTLSDSEKTPEQAAEEKRVLDELLEVVEERDKLVAMLEEDRVR